MAIASTGSAACANAALAIAADRNSAVRTRLNVMANVMGVTSRSVVPHRVRLDSLVLPGLTRNRRLAGADVPADDGCRNREDDHAGRHDRSHSHHLAPAPAQGRRCDLGRRRGDASCSGPGAAGPGRSRPRSPARRRRVLIKGGIVLTLDRSVGDFAKADVLIEDGKIREIRPDIAPAEAAVVEAGNRILVPGFVDTHSHSYQGLLRSSLPNGLVDPDYNRDVQNNLTMHYTPADVYAGVLTTALSFIDNGTT